MHRTVYGAHHSEGLHSDFLLVRLHSDFLLVREPSWRPPRSSPGLVDPLAVVGVVDPEWEEVVVGSKAELLR